MKNIALITGITGQDGSYLSELLIEKKYKVYGIVRRNSMIFNYNRIEHIKNDITLKYGDLSDGSSLASIIYDIINENDGFHIFEIYNLAAQSHVQISFDTPEYTSIVDGIGTLKILEVIKSIKKETRDKIRFYQAGTSEMYGTVLETPQNELTPFNPQSPYACAKVYSHYIVKNYREAYGIYACNGILFNHESPRRGANFVTAKIINGIKDFMKAKIPFIQLGNIHSKRDWGHAKDYVKGMWLMLQQDKPDDYVLATGVTLSVKEFIEKAFKYVNIEIGWEGTGEEEIAYNNYDHQTLVKIDKKYFRPCEVDLLLGDASKAREKLGWELNYNIDSLIKDMFENN